MMTMLIATAGFAGACDGDTAATGDTSQATDTIDAADADTSVGEDTSGSASCSVTSAGLECGACSTTTGQDGEAVACVGGQIVDGDGAPIAGLKVSACTLQTCIIGDTDDNGHYLINRVPVAPHKMEVLGQLKGYATMVFYQPTVSGVLTKPADDIVMVPLTDTPTAWAPADGGAVSLAGGMLDLVAEAGVLHYPLGTVDKSVVAAEMDADDLPPFDIAPWEGVEAETRVFIINPFPVSADTSIAMTVHGADGVAADAKYDVYTANELEGVLELVGTATANGSGDIVLDDDAELKTLTTIIIVPQG